MQTDANISGVRNDPHFDAQAPIPARPDGLKPDCTVAPFLD
ncbi:MAG: hypothetical protein U0802_13140 [Candidatus Binatia bacterium]